MKVPSDVGIVRPDPKNNWVHHGSPIFLSHALKNVPAGSDEGTSPAGRSDAEGKAEGAATRGGREVWTTWLT